MDKYKFDIETKREGWNQMEAILDKEMPVKKKHLLPFLFLFLILSIAGITFMLKGMDNNKQKDLKYNNQTFSKDRLKYKDAGIKNKTQNGANTINNNQIKPGTNKSIGPNSESKFNTLKKNKSGQQKNINPDKNHNIYAIAKPHEYSVETTENKEFSKINPVEIASNDKTIVLNKISKIDLPGFLPETTEINPQFDFNNFSIFENKKKKIFHPFAGIKVHSYNYKEFSPKFEFDLGSYLKVNSRFSFGFGIAVVQRNLIYQIVKKEDFTNSNSVDFEKNEQVYSYVIINQNSEQSWGLELMIMEKYNFSNKISINLSGGVELSKINFTTNRFSYKNADLSAENGIYLQNVLDNYDPIYFADIALQYSFTNKILASLGYKYYFYPRYIITDKNMNLYSLKLINKPYSSKYFVGIKYVF